MERAAELYRSELLESFHARAPAFEDWLMHEQSRLREQAIEVLQRLLAHYRQSMQGERAIQLALRLLALDPLRESVHRDLMERYARQGRHGQALRQYRICRSVLQRELGVVPEPATERLYRDLLQARHAPADQGLDVDAALPGDTHSPVYQRGAGGDFSAAPLAPAQAFQALQAQAVSQDSSSPELRQATVLVTRLAGMEGAAADPEQAHERLSRYLEAVGTEVGHFGGCIVQRMGDAVMAVFGLPAAHSNDPERAVRAADAIQRAVTVLPGQCLGARLAARVGIACGRVMAGGGGGEQAVTGEAAEQAMAIAARAGAGETLLADGVYQGVYRQDAAHRGDGSARPCERFRLSSRPGARFRHRDRLGRRAGAGARAAGPDAGKRCRRSAARRRAGAGGCARRRRWRWLSNTPSRRRTPCAAALPAPAATLCSGHLRLAD
jgi:class 3 adenylate cyclase